MIDDLLNLKRWLLLIIIIPINNYFSRFLLILDQVPTNTQGYASIISRDYHVKDGDVFVLAVWYLEAL